MALQTYEKMSKAKKVEATHNNVGTSAHESGETLRGMCNILFSSPGTLLTHLY